MHEGYLIVNANSENSNQVELLAYSIKKIDSKRRIVATTGDRNLDRISNVDDVVYVNYDNENQVFGYFNSLRVSPFEKTIALLPDQILTKFDTELWTVLNNMTAIVLPEQKINFAGDRIWPSAYLKDSIEEKTFSRASVINAVYLNRTRGADDILQFACDFCSTFNYENVVAWIQDRDDIFLPVFPETLWEQWVFGFMSTMFEDKFMTLNFINCIDLSIQENNFWSPFWSKEPWTKFLTYWITDKGDIKIENYVQLGLIKYQHADWLSKDNINLLKDVNERV